MICTKSVSGPTFKTDLIPLQRKDSIFEPHQRQDSNMHLKVDIILKQSTPDGPTIPDSPKTQIDQNDQWNSVL